jgi:hypothetical protein
MAAPARRAPGIETVDIVATILENVTLAPPLWGALGTFAGILISQVTRYAIVRHQATRDDRLALVQEASAAANAALRSAQDGQEALARGLFQEMADLRAELREWRDRCRVAEEIVMRLRHEVAGLHFAMRQAGVECAPPACDPTRAA